MKHYIINETGFYEKPMKKLHCSGYYWQVNEEWIKQEILKFYYTDVQRKLVVSRSLSNYGKVGYVLYAVEGSPPKGCAIYNPEYKRLKIIDYKHDKVKTYNNILVMTSE